MRSTNISTRRVFMLASCLFIQPMMSAHAEDGVAVTALPVWVNYECAKNRTFSVDRSQAPRLARVLIKDKTIVLPGGNSAAQEKYTDGDYILYLDGEAAMLEHLGRVLFGPCKSAVALPKYQRELEAR